MPYSAYQNYCLNRQQTGLWRHLRTMTPAAHGRIEVAGHLLINFSSNNYLGLANNPILIKKARLYCKKYGVGAQASRLVCGNSPLFDLVETKLAQGKKSEAALVFNSGFQANCAILAALLDKNILNNQLPLVFSDRLNHASIHQGCLLAGVHQKRYHHNDLNHLEHLLQQSAAQKGPKFILSETVFSMDGDQADVAGLIQLKERYGAFLYLDEAHATGVLGPNGFGLAAEFPGGADLVMGTFSKALGGFGAYAACSRLLRDYLINRAAGLIYSTALPPAVLGTMAAALELLPALGEQRQKLTRLGQQLRIHLQEIGLNTGNSSTQIVPLFLGAEHTALQWSQSLEKAGLLAVAIRPPTVPMGQSRLRFSLTADHTNLDLAQLLVEIQKLAQKMLYKEMRPR
ncbi:MAG: 8-amino-7-oxononanoate synthase [Magnetococcus sp. DMHC-6]